MTVSIENERHRAKIKVIGIGGCGGNIINYLHERDIEGVSYAAINTDSQALSNISSDVDCVQIGQNITSGLGAGAKPEIAAEAAIADSDRLREMIKGLDMLFITAGMGKGTGTGASPVAAQIARELGVLTIAVVTRPFNYERRDKQADNGLAALAKYVDSLIVVPNEKLREVLGGDVTAKTALAAANDVLYNAVCGISEIITKAGILNLDFNDIRSIMSVQGKAVIGSACASGNNRAEDAAYAALRCPLMEDVDLSNAAHVLVNISGHEDGIKMSETERIEEIVTENIPDCQSPQFCGMIFDDKMKDELRVTVIVTGVRDSNVSPMPLTDVSQQMQDSSFISGRKRHQVDKISEEAGGDHRKVPTVLRRQIS